MDVLWRMKNKHLFYSENKMEPHYWFLWTSLSGVKYLRGDYNMKKESF